MSFFTIERFVLNQAKDYFHMVIFLIKVKIVNIHAHFKIGSANYEPVRPTIFLLYFYFSIESTDQEIKTVSV